jgi:beta-glucosidase
VAKILKFPENFLWGAATSAYQVEGGIENCDWSKIYPAGRACDNYHLYQRDFDLLRELNLSAYRFSVEWSRIEPEKGKFNEREIEHYRKVLSALKSRDIKIFLSLHHFTNPRWLAKEGGWANKRVVFYFSCFAKKVFGEYKDMVDFWITLNEPLVYATHAYLKGIWPPKKKNPILCLKVIKNQIKAHKNIYQVFHKEKDNVQVGIAKNASFIEPYNSNSPLDKLSASLSRYFWNEYFLDQIRQYQDFIGLNYYFHDRIKFPFQKKNENKIVSDLGWEVYPQGIYYVLKELYQRYQKPIYITENGLADAKDKLRKDFIKEHLFWIHRAIQEGVDIRGYLYWSLMDNFEWDKGFWPCFGLVEIDYKTLARKIRPSAYFYAKICENNQLEL